MANPYDTMTDEDFDRILRETINDTWNTTCDVLEVPGVYEILREHLNNEVLERWEAEQNATDFTVEHHGSIMLVTPQTDAARAWVTDHIPMLEPWQWIGQSFAVEPRYLDTLIAGIEDDALTVQR